MIELASIFPPVGHYMSQNNALSVIEALEAECLCIEDDADSCFGSPFEGVVLRDARLCLEENQASSSAWSMLGVQLFQEREIEGNNYTKTVARFNEGLYGLIDACR